MHLALTFSSTIAAYINSTAGILAAAYKHGGKEPKARPLLGVLVQNFRSPNPNLHQGNLVLRYEYDCDATTSATAAADLQTAADHLVTDDSLTAINALLAADSIWLRRITAAAGSAAIAETGERTRTLDLILPFHFQTKI